MFVGVESFNRQTLLSAHKGQNRPETYLDIVRLCRAYGITSHFSNIIGFPQDTEQEIHEHLKLLREMDPTWASFYILCPIPGTEQYDDFQAAGLIAEKNLDRFDTTCLTWRHPYLSAQKLTGLLFDCYRRFFSWGHSVRNVCDQLSFRGQKVFKKSAESLASSLFVRYCTSRQTHPMSGGIMRVLRDRAADYLPWRRKMFDFELAPLPHSLQLSTTEIQLKLPGNLLHDSAVPRFNNK
jgi:radical SAM superfamily enzyme YgiQ (UPF0313 family)